MSKLKLRVWDKETGEYLKGVEAEDFVLKLNGDRYVEMSCGYYSKGKDWVIEQYIGLKDKNCKEIYEGDIVSYRGNNYQIKWCEASFAYIASSKNQYYWLSPSKSTVFEVIGNIHENPELCGDE